MTMRLTRKQLLLARLETVYGTAPTLDVNQAMLVHNLSFKGASSSMLSRPRAYPDFQVSSMGVAPSPQSLSFDVEAAGSGAQGTQPLWGRFMRACGMGEFVPDDSSYVDYYPLSAPFPSSISEKFNWDGTAHLLTGARGNVTFSAEAGKEPLFSFAFTALYNVPTDTALLDVTDRLNDFLDPETVSDYQTAFALFGKQAPLSALTFDLNNTVSFRDKPNLASVDITDRPQPNGKATVEASQVADVDWFSLYKAKTLGTLQFAHGRTKGNKIAIGSPYVQLGEPNYTNVNGVLHVELPLYFIRASNDRELRIRVY
jgi:hypothetical protein